MSTTKQMSLMEMINRLSAGIEDDELFCQEKFEMVRNYCEQKSFMMSAADLSTIRRIGLMDRFESWKEEHRLYGLTFDQARKRKDYSFTLNELPPLIDDLQKNYMSATCENGDPYRGVAVLEVGYVDVELNITTYEQCGRSVTENDKRPILRKIRGFGGGSGEGTHGKLFRRRNADFETSKTGKYRNAR